MQLPTITPDLIDNASDEQIDAWLGKVPVAASAAQKVTLHDLMIRVIDQETGAGKLLNLGENLNVVQKMLLDLWCPDWLLGDYKLAPGLREDVLKARQEGCSTLILALMFLTVYNNPYTYAITMAHDADHTERMFQIVKRFYEHLPDSKKRKAKYDTRRELRWEDSDSGIFVAQAGSGNVGRSGTWTLVHMSERARWQVPLNGAAELEAGLLAAVPRSGVAWKETTAQGLNDYYTNYQKAKKGESAFTPRFFGWNLHPDYRFWPPDPKDRPWRRDEEEELLARTYHLDDKQLAWRRWKKREQGDLFEQEYPINDAEAFRTSSENAYFDRNYLYKLLVELDGEDHKPIEVIEAGQRGFSGKVEVYVEYDPEYDYLVVGDPAMGVTEYGTDYSVARVMCIQTWEECVVYEGKPSLGKFASDMAALGSHYGGAEVCPLRHAHGHAVVLALEQIERYSNLYHHQAFDDTQRLRGEGPILAKPGYPESSRTKPEMMDSLAEVISDMANGEKGLILHNRRGAEQLLTYVRLPGAKTGTGEGSANDDHVSTLAVAVMRLLDRQKRWTTPRKQAPPRLLYGSR